VNHNTFPERIAALPKAELHLHLEGSIRPAIAVQLAKRHGVELSEDEVRRRYDYRNFAEFLDAFKWVTSFLADPQDFGLLGRDLAEQLLEQNVCYAEITLSVGVMLLRKQNPQANFEALLETTEMPEKKGLRLNWIFDAVRQFGPDMAAEVVQWAKACRSPRIVAFGIGGDEMSIATGDFRRVYQAASEYGLRRLIHAGEIGGPEKIRGAIELLEVDRIGHGIAAVQDMKLVEILTERQIALEICPTSNICTGALGRQTGIAAPTIRDHPLPTLLRNGVPVVLSTDDPAMFHVTLTEEYQKAQAMGLTEKELKRLVENSFKYSFLSAEEKKRLHLRGV